MNTQPTARRNGTVRRRRAFSLIELMIAIVILGLGLVMVATMFPVALGRARQLSRFTRQTAITEVAHATITMLARVDGRDNNAGTFAGDMLFDATTGDLITYGDTRVHYLGLENLLVEVREFTPNRQDPWNDPNAPWVAQRLFFGSITADELKVDCDNEDRDFCYNSFLRPAVRFGSRVYPPLLARDNVDAEGVFDPNPDSGDAQWDELFSTRRYAWAVFHRLRERVGPNPYEFDPFTPDSPSVGEASDAANQPRDFDVYYVTLRRQHGALRYARQDPSSAPDSQVLSVDPIVPVALGPEEDVLLPEPWRVQIQIPDTINAEIDATAIPTEVVVPPPDTGASPGVLVMLADMFQRGTRFVDELNGQVYRVVRRRLAPDGDSVTLTLDREIVREDVNLVIDSDFPALCPTCTSAALDPEELLRTVWVFPPPVQATRAAGDVVMFDGAQPVVGIETRSLVLTPRS